MAVVTCGLMTSIRNCRTCKAPMRARNGPPTFLFCCFAVLFVLCFLSPTDESKSEDLPLRHLNLAVSRVCVQTKVRTTVRARERKDEDEET